MAYRLPNGFGSVYKLSGNRRKPWAARKTVGWKDNGQPVYAFVGYYTTRTEALTALSDYNKDPYDLHISSITFEELYDKWSDEHFKKISDSSIKAYSAAYKCCSPLYRTRVVDIKLDHLQRAIDGSGKNSPTLKNVKNMFGLMWDYAVVHEIVPPDKRKIIHYLDITKAGNPNKVDRAPFTKEEIDRLWKSEPGNEYISAVLIMIYTGMRIGELLDLRKEEVHLEERWINVRRSKTAAGVREVPIAEKIVPFIGRWLQNQTDMLICAGSGVPMSYYVFRENYWTGIMETLGMEKHRPHDTRHTCVSMLTETGADPRIIRQIVGHKGQGVTEAVYTHVDLPAKLEAINKI